MNTSFARYLKVLMKTFVSENGVKQKRNYLRTPVGYLHFKIVLMVIKTNHRTAVQSLTVARFFPEGRMSLDCNYSAFETMRPLGPKISFMFLLVQVTVAQDSKPFLRSGIKKYTAGKKE